MSRLAALRVAWLAMAVFAVALPGATKTQLRMELKDLHHRSWTSDDGLPNDRVFKITQSPQGYLWMSTEGGLVRFDGLRFALPTPAPAGTEDYLIAAEPSGEIWVTRFKQKRGELLHGKDGRLEPFPLPAAATDMVPLSLVRSRDGSLWIGGYFGGVIRIGKDGATHRFTAAEGVPAAERVNAILEDRMVVSGWLLLLVECFILRTTNLNRWETKCRPWRWPTTRAG